jgi:predicted DNA-binding transcriptional regulator YafY
MIVADFRFDDIIGVTIPPPEVQKEHIELEFDPKRLPYIISKPIHSSQYIVNKERGIISIDVRPNKELESLILSFGPQVKVLSPEGFQRQIKEKLEENAKKYL